MPLLLSETIGRYRHISALISKIERITALTKVYPYQIRRQLDVYVSRQDWRDKNHSYRSAISGSTLLARRAGR
jgi:hypothetical protein